VPLVAAAILPHPPLIVPEVAAGAAAEMDGLRAACDEAVARVLAAAPDAVHVVGSAGTTTVYRYPYHASFAAWGVPVEARLGGSVPDRPVLPLSVLPLSVAVGVWLLARAVAHGRVTRPTTWAVATIAGAASPAQCRRLATAVLDRPAAAPSVGLLVMGDGSACRTVKAPGYLDPRAEAYDASVTAAFGKADVEALLALDPVLSAELMVAGRAPWQVLAAAAAGRRWTGDVLYDDAPYGVQYTVATWLPA
jgi:hypothetical protein